MNTLTRCRDRIKRSRKMLLGATMKKIKIDHINLLHLKGTKGEMAFQHGSLLKEEIQNSALQKLASKNQFVISEAKGIFGIKWIQKSVVNIYEKIRNLNNFA